MYATYICFIGSTCRYMYATYVCFIGSTSMLEAPLGLGVSSEPFLLFFFLIFRKKIGSTFMLEAPPQPRRLLDLIFPVSFLHFFGEKNSFYLFSSKPPRLSLGSPQPYFFFFFSHFKKTEKKIGSTSILRSRPSAWASPRLLWAL
jgi:hypothetical protein